MDGSQAVVCSAFVLEILQSDTFEAWLRALRDSEGKARVLAGIRRLGLGNPGQHRVLKGGVVAMKIDFGPGYRVYDAQRGSLPILLSCVGDKSTQKADIDTATRIASRWKE